MTIGEEIQKARRKAGLTQEQLAALARMDRTYLSDLEREKKSPTLSMLFRICDSLDVSAGAMVARVERQRRKQSR